MSLYQEIRPTNFKDVVGNSEAVGAFMAMLRKPVDARPHAILLKGPSGCGKTTIARILAKEFGAPLESIFELNAANTNGVATVRGIAENAPLVGFGGGAKVYIFDECHEFSGKAQECLLKVIEDNPPHCYFIFCTTDPESLIPTIHNRCAEYTVRLLLDKEIRKVLVQACEKKGYDVTAGIMEALVQTCDGSPRASLVALEKVVGMTDVDSAIELIINGTEQEKSILDLFNLLAMGPVARRKKWKKIITTFDAINEDSERIRFAVMTFLYNKLKKYDNVEDAMDITHLLKIFSNTTFYGKKSLMGALIARACFETWKE